jgi:hypothetical protein
MLVRNGVNDPSQNKGDGESNEPHETTKGRDGTEQPRKSYKPYEKACWGPTLFGSRFRHDLLAYLMMLLFAPGAGGIIVGIGCGLCGALIFGNVAQVDADAIPDGGAASHAVDEDVVFGEMLGGFRMGCLPAV